MIKIHRKFKITLWLEPEEYLLLMKRSTELEAGKISMHKCFKKTFELEKAKETADRRAVGQAVRHMYVPAPKPQAEAFRGSLRRHRALVAIEAAGERAAARRAPRRHPRRLAA